jgi:hypothetical protein
VNFNIKRTSAKKKVDSSQPLGSYYWTCWDDTSSARKNSQRMNDVNFVLDGHGGQHRQGSNDFEGIDQAVFVGVEKHVQLVAILGLLQEATKLPLSKGKPEGHREETHIKNRH